jgi:putative phosphoribosyl transferase
MPPPRSRQGSKTQIMIGPDHADQSDMGSHWRFRDRRDAGAAVAAHLAEYAGRPDVIVLALPRGGAPVASVVAEHLSAPLDVFVVRKLGVPGHEEYAFGAIASGGKVVLNREVMDSVGLTSEMIRRIAAEEERELARREHAYRDDRPPPDIRGRTVILVDDGLATGSTMYAAVMALRQFQPARIVIAVPVGSPPVVEMLRGVADEVVSVLEVDPLGAVGLWYEEFPQLSDDEVRTELDAAARRVLDSEHVA